MKLIVFLFLILISHTHLLEVKKSFIYDSLPKIKKIKIFHDDIDHGSYNVDTDWVHVILKTTIEDWKDGPRIVSAFASMLNMDNYFTFGRLDRNEVTFRVEENPENRTTADVARDINHSRFKNNISRRLGVIIVRAGVGDKTKSNTKEPNSKKVDEKDGPNMTLMFHYLVAGVCLGVVVVIVMTLILIRCYDKKRDNFRRLQARLTASGARSKDYQELWRVSKDELVSAACPLGPCSNGSKSECVG